MNYYEKLEKTKKMAIKIMNSIESAENFAMAMDGRVPRTSEVLGEAETEKILKAAYRLSKEVMHL